jgi:quercetin dioxygenase-like cupin family protein
MTDPNFIRPLDHAQVRADKAFKHTFLETPRLLTGLNCLAPGQEQHIHDHPDQDKFYFILQGEGRFTVGETTQVCGTGELILAPAGVPHGVLNHGAAPLTFLTVIAPWPDAR